MGDTEKAENDPGNDEPSEELTAEERIRANRRFVGANTSCSPYWVHLRNFKKFKLSVFIYGPTPAEAWNKAQTYLITERLKS